MMIQFFVTDLDNTLLNDQKEINPQDQLALEKLMAAGVKICLASGRSDHEIFSVMSHLEAKYHRISQNGAYVRTPEGVTLRSTVFEGDLAKRIYESAEEKNLFGFIATEDRILVTNRNHPSIPQIEEGLKIQFEEHPGALHEIGQQLQPSKLCYFGTEDQLHDLQSHIQHHFPNEVDSYISDVHCVDLMPKHVSKGTALAYLLDHLQIQPDSVACAGDSYNDISMFELIPHSFVMKHANPEVKAHAKREIQSVSEAVEWILQYNKTCKI
ncbi:HAD family hydrolase [Baia soyae]|nr:HAD family hydrolase [Baia soyae]